MKNKFKIKNFTLIIIMIFCMFFSIKNVDAKQDKYVCYYRSAYYGVPLYVQLTFENNKADIKYYNHYTGEVFDRYDANDSPHVYIIKEGSGKSITAADFKNGCPPELHEYEWTDINNEEAGFLYDIYKGEDLKTWQKQSDSSTPNGFCYDISEYCGHLLKHQYEDGKTTEGNSNNRVYCNYSHDTIQEGGQHISLTYDIDNNYLNFDVSSTIFQPDSSANGLKEPVVNFTIEDLKKYEGKCPEKIYSTGARHDNFYLTSTNGEYLKSYSLIKKLLQDSDEFDSCIKLGGVLDYIKAGYKLLKFIIPAVIIILSVISFLGVVFSGEKESMEKAKKNFVIRLIVGIIILFIPTCLELILKLAGVIEKGEGLVEAACNLF